MSWNIWSWMYSSWSCQKCIVSRVGWRWYLVLKFVFEELLEVFDSFVSWPFAILQLSISLRLFYVLIIMLIKYPRFLEYIYFFVVLVMFLLYFNIQIYYIMRYLLTQQERSNIFVAAASFDLFLPNHPEYKRAYLSLT